MNHETKPLDDDILHALHLQAQEYRYRMRLHQDAPLDVEVPLRYAVDAVVRYGSLRAAADAVFNPGSVTIVCREWRAAQDRVNILFQTGPRPWRLSHPDDLLRIAVTHGSGKIAT